MGSRNAKSCNPARDATSHAPATSRYPSPAARQNCAKDFVPEITNLRKPSPANPAQTKSQELANQAAAMRFSRKNETVVSKAAANNAPSKTALLSEAPSLRNRSAPSGTTTHGPSRNNTSIMPRCTLAEKLAAARTPRSQCPIKSAHEELHELWIPGSWPGSAARQKRRRAVRYG